MSKSQLSSHFTPSPPTTPPRASPDMAARAQASGRGATGLSRLAPAPFQQLPLFSRVDGAALEERLGKHNNLYIAQQRDNLFNALRQEGRRWRSTRRLLRR